MIVIKRDGTEEGFNPQKIQERILKQCTGLKVDGDALSIKVIGGFADRMTTVELDNLAAETAATMTMNHPDYSYLASRIAISRLHKETLSTFYTAMESLASSTDLLSERFRQLVVRHANDYNSYIVHDRDYNFDYFGYKTLERAYLLRSNNKVVERPQYMFMRVAVAMWEDNLEMVKKVYDDLSTGLYIHATPTLFNAGTKHQQLASCFLIGNKGDSKEGLLDTFKDVSIISSYAGGIGLHISDVRAEGSKIHGSGGKSNGILSLLRTYNEGSKWWNQQGKRNGSYAIYLEPWHKDIEVFLDIRKNHGKEELRARELFPALWTPNLFMQRVEANDKWTLFCPNEILRYNGVKLQELVGDDFKQAYEELELVSGLGRTIKAQDLWNQILVAQMETGTPYLGYKDAVNLKSNQKNLGVIKSSNLCIEINEYSDENEQAVCNLASLALPKYLRETIATHLSYGQRTPDMVIAHPIKYEINHEALYNAAYQVTLNLNRVIDITYYPTVETKRSNLRHRPLGIGCQGMADVFAIMRIPFDSPEARQINKDIFETIYFGALNASCDLAKVDGTYESYEGSPVSKGILQFDMWNIIPSNRWNWSKLKEDIKANDIRNSLLLAPMPTASTSQILGWTECFEPFNSNLSTRGTLAGTFVIINKHLVKELEAINLWNPAMKNKLVVSNGSVQNIPEIPQELKDIYKTSYEISQKVIIDMAADRGAYVCQGQSMNLFVTNPTVAKLSSMHFYGWKKGLKTGMYYLRTKAAVDALKGLGMSSIVEDKKIFTEEEALACSIDNPVDCAVCGS